MHSLIICVCPRSRRKRKQFRQLTSHRASLRTSLHHGVKKKKHGQLRVAHSATCVVSHFIDPCFSPSGKDMVCERLRAARTRRERGAERWRARSGCALARAHSWQHGPPTKINGCPIWILILLEAAKTSNESNQNPIPNYQVRGDP